MGLDQRLRRFTSYHAACNRRYRAARSLSLGSSSRSYFCSYTTLSSYKSTYVYDPFVFFGSLHYHTCTVVRQHIISVMYEDQGFFTL